MTGLGLALSFLVVGAGVTWVIRRAWELMADALDHPGSLMPLGNFLPRTRRQRREELLEHVFRDHLSLTSYVQHLGSLPRREARRELELIESAGVERAVELWRDGGGR